MIYYSKKTKCAFAIFGNILVWSKILERVLKVHIRLQLPKFGCKIFKSRRVIFHIALPQLPNFSLEF
ncbi:hypothetical protein A2Y83_04895 [Candidatus Falkowbacteria bacterium RBG_13_39_14]|uniref:Uncharacterized protein n=1 Tax=Candidatus Falkowbacteria bacterium RBG_13_39_14 TaxID=1797985 RepID=A0A1F5S6D6_9BACT|nr:MAG: hypothetical protein A2Y83_04895 [Candidatus Falkowbacteria bacterium RBG_13_39_14]